MNAVIILTRRGMALVSGSSHEQSRRIALLSLPAIAIADGFSPWNACRAWYLKLILPRVESTDTRAAVPLSLTTTSFWLQHKPSRGTDEGKLRDFITSPLERDICFWSLLLSTGGEYKYSIVNVPLDSDMEPFANA